MLEGCSSRFSLVVGAMTSYEGDAMRSVVVLEGDAIPSEVLKGEIFLRPLPVP